MQLVPNARTEAASRAPGAQPDRQHSDRASDAHRGAEASFTERHGAAAPAPHRPLHIGLARAREHLREHVAVPISLDALARVACLSKYHFLRAFTRAFGISPHEYQMQLRLTLARTLVAAGEPLSSVAYDAGFADQSHLTRRFKQAFGITPGAFARASKLSPRVA